MKQTSSESARPLFRESEDARLFFLLPYSVRKALLRRWFNKCSVLRRSASALHNGARFPAAPYIPILKDARTPEKKKEDKRAFYRRKRAKYLIRYALPLSLPASASEDNEKKQARAQAILFMRRHGLGADLNPNEGTQKKT